MQHTPMKKWDDITAVMNGCVNSAFAIVLACVFIPVTLVYKRVAPHDLFTIPRLFHSTLLKILGIKVRVIGTPSTSSPVLFVANHVSYLDVPVLGAILPAAFVAKSEVSTWPVIGFLSRLQNTIFIERRSSRAAEQRTQLQDHVAKLQNLILFPEGTSSDGLQALPFKSSLFSIVEGTGLDKPITVQPVSVTCTELNGLRLTAQQRPLFGWYGDMTLPPHLWNTFKRGRFTVEVIFHQPLTTAECPNRKLLASTCQTMVARGIEHSLAGRPQVEGIPVLTANE